MRRCVLTIFPQSCLFYNNWQILYQKHTVFTYHCLFNLKKESRLFIRNINSIRYAATATLSESETDVNKFLNHLMDAYKNDKSTEFNKILQNRLVRKLFNERINLVENIKSLEELAHEDQEMKNLAEEEKSVVEDKLRIIDSELINLLLNDLDENKFHDVIMEVSAGVGGQEAMLFAKDLFEMYLKHFTYLGYNYDIIELSDSEQGGIRYASINISGKNAYTKLRHEAGVHRVQRIPTTEKAGRVHTSVVSVAILPQPNEIQIEINPKDLKIDTMRASGAGGQHVNVTDSAVRITHLPTGIVSECQTSRSQIKNRSLALAKLRARIYEKQLNKQLQSTTTLRKKQMGMGERNEKIRTYNFNQNRVTDHRLSKGTLHNLKDFLEGGKALDGLHNKLHHELQNEIVKEFLKNRVT